MFEISEIKEKLYNICTRVENLENLSSRYNKNSSRLEVVTSKQLSDLGNGQEQQVKTN